MGNYHVVIHYEGTINYDIESETEQEAKDKAERLFGDESPAEIQANVMNFRVCDCSEEYIEDVMELKH